MTTLYRAADYAEVRVGYSLTQSKNVAKAYQSNPGFGGSNLYKCNVELTGVLDLTESDDVWADLSRAAGCDIDPDRFQDHFARVLPTSDEVCESLANNGYHWVRFCDDFPEGAQTIIPVSSEAAEMADDAMDDA
jgi:hypothetical protein